MLQIIRAQRYRVDELRGFAYFYTLNSKIALKTLESGKPAPPQHLIDFSVFLKNL